MLLVIAAHIAETGVSPSFGELMDALNLKSKSGIHRMLTVLEMRGYVTRLFARARSVVLTHHGEEYVARASPGYRRAAPSWSAPRTMRKEPRDG